MVEGRGGGKFHSFHGSSAHISLYTFLDSHTQKMNKRKKRRQEDSFE